MILVNKIKQNREVTINIPDENHGSAIIRIEGNKQGVHEAKAVSYLILISYGVFLSGVMYSGK